MSSPSPALHGPHPFHAPCLPHIPFLLLIPSTFSSVLAIPSSLTPALPLMFGPSPPAPSPSLKSHSLRARSYLRCSSIATSAAAGRCTCPCSASHAQGCLLHGDMVGCHPPAAAPRGEPTGLCPGRPGLQPLPWQHPKMAATTQVVGLQQNKPGHPTATGFGHLQLICPSRCPPHAVCSHWPPLPLTFFSPLFRFSTTVLWKGPVKTYSHVMAQKDYGTNKFTS